VALQAVGDEARLLVIGILGGGEIRPVPRMDARIAEAARLGFKSLLLPARGRNQPTKINGIQILRARNLREALALGLAGG
jgi:DNA repair protein RadA/Sms